jgi:hypothetical protein
VTPLPRLYVANLFALIATGVLVSGWLLYYTESFEVVGGLIGLGGLFAWAAFVVGLLTDESKEKLQAGFENGVLLRWRTMLLCLVVVVGVGVLTFMSGTVVLDAEVADADRMVSVSTSTSDGTSSRVAAHSVRRLWLFTGFGATALRVKVDGLPGLDATLQPPFRTHLTVPTAFGGRPLLLVRTTPLQSGSLARAPAEFELHVTLAGKSEMLSAYGGQSVWIGTEDDVPIPANVLQRWRETLTVAAVAAAAGSEASIAPQLSVVELVLARWSAPRAVFSNAVLRPGQQATVEVRRVADKYVLAQATVVVRPASAREAVQEVILE